MSISNLQPSKYWLIPATKQSTRNIPRVTSLDIFSPSSNSFHPEGLFSEEIFGMQGTPERYKKFAVIDLHCQIMSPLLYNDIVGIKKYARIIYGKRYVIFDETTRKFKDSVIGEGFTGISYFLKHIDKIDFSVKNPSTTRQSFLTALNKYRHKSLLVSEAFVLEAGLRDYEIGKDGRASQDEVNTIYRNILRYSSMIPENTDLTTGVYDTTILNIQTEVLALFKYIASLKDGKTKFTRKKFGTRKVHGSTRNILVSSPDNKMKHLDDDIQELDEVKIGLFQFIKGLKDKGIYLVKNHPIILAQRDSRTWYVVDSKTLKRREATVLEAFNLNAQFSTSELVGKFIHSFKDVAMRHIAIGDESFYLGLIYDNPDDENIYFYIDGDDIPDTIDANFVRPITKTDILITAVWQAQSESIAVTTRYPVDNPGSVQITNPYLMSTNEYRPVTVHNADGLSFDIKRYPANTIWVNGIATHSSGWGPQGADSDGDALKTHILVSDEAVAQGKSIIDMDNPAYYKTATGDLKFSPADDVSNAVFAHLG